MLQKWITLIGGTLSEMSLKDIYDKKRICRCHFSNNYFNPGKKALLRTAIPTLLLPGNKLLN
jgi:hypothetical protein